MPSKKILFVCWDTYVPMLRKAAEITDTELFIVPFHSLESDPSAQDRVIDAMKDSELSVFYKSNQVYWDDLDRKIGEFRRTQCDVIRHRSHVFRAYQRGP